MSGQWYPGVAKAQRRALLRRVAVLALLLGVLVVLAALWPRTQPGGLSVATSGAGVQPAGVLRGPLEATRRGDRACFTVTSQGTTAVLRFVPGWSADDRLGLVDPSGSVVAQPGATVTLLGDPGRVGSVAGCSDEGRIWTVTSARIPTPR